MPGRTFAREVVRARGAAMPGSPWGEKRGRAETGAQGARGTAPLARGRAPGPCRVAPGASIANITIHLNTIPHPPPLPPLLPHLGHRRVHSLPFFLSGTREPSIRLSYFLAALARSTGLAWSGKGKGRNHAQGDREARLRRVHGGAERLHRRGPGRAGHLHAGRRGHRVQPARDRPRQVVDAVRRCRLPVTTHDM